MLDLASLRVLVTGGHGFLGRHVCRALERRGVKDPAAPRSADFDLVRPGEAERLLAAVEPDLVLHLAARVGGIGANRARPGTFFYENLVMGTELMEAARRHGVHKFVSVGTICSYPQAPPVPFREEDLWAGYPDPTNAPYGLAKKMLLVQGQAYRKQFGFEAIHVVPTNLYGPGDHFDLESSHVIPALIRRLVEARDAGAGRVVLWGTGTPTRDFLYVEDAAEGLVLAAEAYDDPAPVNLGSGTEISIRELAERVRALVGYRGEIEWDGDRPDGQPRRCVDPSRAKAALGFEATTPLDEGLARTLDDWLARR